MRLRASSPPWMGWGWVGWPIPPSPAQTEPNNRRTSTPALPYPFTLRSRISPSTAGFDLPSAQFHHLAFGRVQQGGRIVDVAQMLRRLSESRSGTNDWIWRNFRLPREIHA